MQLTIFALGSRGDVQPYVALGKGLLQAGYRVRVATFETFREMVVGQSLDFHPVPGDAQALLQMASQNNLTGTRNPFKAMRAIMRSYGQAVDDYIAAFSSDALNDSDAILNQLPGGLFGVDLAEKLQIPHLIVSVIPLTPTHAFPSPLLASQSLGGFFNIQSYYFSAQLLWWFFRPKIGEFRRKLGLADPPHLFKWTDPPVMNGFSQHVVPRPVDWSPDVHITGYWRLDEAEWQPPDDLVRFLEAGTAPVFIGFGSMIAPDPESLTQTLLEAVQRSGQRAVISKGWANLGGVRLPPDIFLLDYAPYHWLFPQMSAVIHHGGSGTTGLALQGGVPSMVVSFGADQPFWGERTRSLGCGVAPIPVKQLSVENLTASIQTLTTNDRLRKQAQNISQLLSAEKGIENAVRIIDRYLRKPHQ